jgi:hypothetical protein
MRQGRATVMGRLDGKVEPRSTAVNPAAVSQIGISLGNHCEEGDLNPSYPSVDAGRGYSAPGIGTTTHGKGSQGKY